MRPIAATFAVMLLALSSALAETPKAFNDQMQLAQQMLRRGATDDAIKAYKKAIKLDPASAEAYWRLAQAYSAARAYKDAVSSCQKALQISSTEEMTALLHATMGQAYEDWGAQDKGKLAGAEREYRAALQAKSPPPITRVQFGRVLMKLGRDEEGKVELQRFLDEHSNSPANAPIQKWITAAQAFIANPRRAREAYIPEFAITTVDGQYINNDDLLGKVVLLDFWGTWCPPCVASVPELRSLAKRFANDPVVVLSISSDTDEEKWRAFIDKNHMTWPQYLDKDKRVERSFGVNSFPTYLVVDAEGIMRNVEHGGGPIPLDEVADAIKKNLKSMQQKGTGAAK